MRRSLSCFILLLALSWSSSVLAQPAAQPKPTQIPAPAAQQAPAAPAPAPGVTVIPGEHVNGCAEPEGRNGTFYGAASFLYVRPHWESNPAASVRTTQGAVARTINHEYTYDFDATPKLILGWVNCDGFGARITWWHFDHNADSIRLINQAGIGAPAPVTQITTQGSLNSLSNALNVGEQSAFLLENSLELTTWDFDLTQAIDLGCVDLVVGGGIRYAHLNQSINERQFLISQTNVQNQHYNASHSFNVFGPTLLIDSRAPIGCNGLAFYTSLRAGALFGRAAVDTNLRSQNAGAPGTNPPFNSSTHRENDAVLPFLEGELGMEWAGQMEGMQPFVRLGIFGSTWFAGTAQGGSSTLGFLGLNVLAGVNY